MMNEIINKIFVVGEFKRQAEFELNEFKKEFGEYIAKNFSDRVILKNGVEIIAISAIEFQRVKVRGFKAYHSRDFMRYVYRNKAKELQQGIKQLKEELKYTVPIVEHNKIVSEKNKENNQLKEVIEKAREFIDKLVVFQDDKGEIYFKQVYDEEYEKISQILDKAGDSGEKKN